MYNRKRDDVLVCVVKLKSENKVKDRKIMWKKKKENVIPMKLAMSWIIKILFCIKCHYNLV